MRKTAESIQEKIGRFSKETYDILCDKYFKVGERRPTYIIHWDMNEFPSDKEGVPACTIYSGDDSDRQTYLTEDFDIHFNMKLLMPGCKFYKYLKLICIHEMCHVFCDVLTKKWNIKQSEYDHAGHPELFFKLMSLFKLNSSERALQHIRHELPYNYGIPETVIKYFSCI